MTTYTNISNASVAVGGIPSSTTVTALRDNPTAIAESSAGAPVVAAGWHPVDKVSVGDGKRGVMYDFATSGTLTDIVTPDFVDGYEYRMIVDSLQHNAGAAYQLDLDLYNQTAAAYTNVVRLGDASAGIRWSIEFDFLTPRISKRAQTAFWRGAIGSSFGDGAVGLTSSTLFKILRARLRYRTSGGSVGSNIVSGGTVWLFRRREYASAD